jgi:competence protein ComEC
VARMGGSRAHAASALELAALLMLLASPSVLWDVGFQLSLLATAGLIWYGAAVERRLPGWPAWIREPVALTLAAQLTTLPVILVNFERLSIVAPVANVLVVPFVPVAMLLSAVAAITGLAAELIRLPAITDVGTWFAGGAAWLVLRVIILLGTAVASLPHAAVPVTVPAPLAVAWLPVLALGTWALRSDRPAEEGRQEPAVPTRLARLLRPQAIVAALLAALVAVTVASRPDGDMHLTVLDIGQGDAILVESASGRTMLVDGGPDPELTLRRLGANLPFATRRIDVMVLSHPHQDHVAGLVDVLGRFRVEALLHADIDFENPAYRHLLADAPGEAAITVARAGQRFALDASTTLEVLYPTGADAAAPLPEGDINNGSVVLLLRYGGFSALLTGDAEAPVEAALVGRNLVPVVDLLKVGHHGSHSSTTPGLVDALRPTVAVISAGRDNEYGHPAAETLATLGARPEIATFRTDLDGDVEVVSDGATYRVRTDAGWTAPRMVHSGQPAGSIGPWPSRTEQPPDACSTTPGCPMGSSFTPRAWLASPWRPPASSPRRRSRSTAPSSRRPRCCTTSTRSRSGARAASTGSSARGASRRQATLSSPCRSPPTRSARSSTMTAFPSAGPRSSWPSPTGTWRRSS